MGLEPASVRASVRLFTLSNMNISTTSRPIPTKFYLKHHWGGGKAVIGFGPDRIGTLVSMANDSSHRVIMGKNLVSTLAPSFLIGSSSYLQVTRTTIISRTSSHFGQIRPRTAELAALERLKKIPYTYNGRNLVSSFIFDRIFFIIAGKEDNHKSLDEFKFRPDFTMDCRVSCP